ncbi:hypothetical protein WN51_02928 [Melipona quadrifasciata]|uniref:Uncharacterized protein n=1 Tax=Melipona quadrifasciata TaxID=166423 RepID=A0A0N0BJU4_9HYME|nr:hypothetical protein WN51_02928 [Melipona quadrifasciata]
MKSSSSERHLQADCGGDGFDEMMMVYGEEGEKMPGYKIAKIDRGGYSWRIFIRILGECLLERRVMKLRERIKRMNEDVFEVVEEFCNIPLQQRIKISSFCETQSESLRRNKLDNEARSVKIISEKDEKEQGLKNSRQLATRVVSTSQQQSFDFFQLPPGETESNYVNDVDCPASGIPCKPEKPPPISKMEMLLDVGSTALKPNFWPLLVTDRRARRLRNYSNAQTSTISVLYNIVSKSLTNIVRNFHRAFSSQDRERRSIGEDEDEEEKKKGRKEGSTGTLKTSSEFLSCSRSYRKSESIVLSELTTNVRCEIYIEECGKYVRNYCSVFNK